MQGGGDHQGEANAADVLAHLLLGIEHIGDDLGQGAIVADAAGQDKGDAVADALVHDAAFQDPLCDCVFDPSLPANGVDGPQVMFVAFLSGQTTLQGHSQAGAVEGLFDVVGGQGVAGEKDIQVTHANQG